MTEALAMYEQQLAKLETPVEYSKEPIHIPSYHELYPSHVPLTSHCPKVLS